ncbi:MAG: ABC transporter ATP-binding protein [Actinomycetota bacterium]
MTLETRIGISWPSLQLDVDLRVESGRTLAIMGPNGAGKSTALRALAGLLALHEGFVRVDGAIWDDPKASKFMPAPERNVGLVFQDHLLFAHMTVLDNVAFGPRARGHSKNEARELASDCLNRLCLGHLADNHPRQLSGGQSQRVALARALVNRPDLLLLDEPLASLDVVTRRHMRTEISRDLGTLHPMTILVTHDPEDARLLADDVVVIEHGKIVQRGTPDELATRPATPYVAELFDRT